jgi:DNA excision repair protein ERCC-4
MRPADRWFPKRLTVWRQLESPPVRVVVAGHADPPRGTRGDDIEQTNVLLPAVEASDNLWFETGRGRRLGFRSFHEGRLMEPKITVIADDREVRAGAMQHLLARPDCEVITQRPRLGDYHIAGRLLVERKRWRDLVASIVDGRLFRQACRLAGPPLHAVVLLEGSEEDIAESAMTREAIQGALISVNVILGIPVMRSRDREESARLMLYAGRQVRSVISGAVVRAGYRPKSKRRIQLHILQGLPTVGPVRAARLLDKYGTVEAVLTASHEDLIRLLGIGNAAPERIRWAVSEPETGKTYLCPARGSCSDFRGKKRPATTVGARTPDRCSRNERRPAHGRVVAPANRKTYVTKMASFGEPWRVRAGLGVM